MDDRFRRRCPKCGAVDPGEGHSGSDEVDSATTRLSADDDFDAAAEDQALLARWLAGPGARPTKSDHERWARASAEGRLPRRLVPAE